MKGILNFRTKRMGRPALLLAVATVAVGGSLLGTDTANAAVGKDPGKVALNPASGATTLTPTWSTSEACPAGFQGSADLEAVTPGSNPPSETVISPLFAGNVTVPFSGTLRGSMSAIQSLTSTPNGSTQEFVVFCHSGRTGNTSATPVMDTYIQWSADGSTYTETNTPPAGPAATPTGTATATATPADTGGVPIGVTIGATPTATANPAIAPATGGGTGPGSNGTLAALGAGVVVAGGGLIVLARRRRRHGAA